MRLGFTLADRVAAWATSNDGARFSALCDAMRATYDEDDTVSVSDIDVAARSVGALRWVDGRFDVCSPGTGEE